ncbi:conserved hypothetical protein [Hyphomicrobiales bacterium]|nr:conserved hypothetical protein [Hyphomicrobiales bacterium]CAH1697280.1 conserved hypothetical protein [Hyphomicrobiales bacterium]CAI0342847.1 conserved hypothetical protein [Hyphomicrobiales bacterium]
MSTQPDPILAAIADFKPYGSALQAVMNTDDDQAVDKAWRPAYDRLNAIYRMTPETPAGLLALMDIMLEWDGHHLRLTEERRGEADDLDDADRALVAAVFRHAKRMLEQMQ